MGSMDWGALAGGVLQTVNNIWGSSPASQAPVIIQGGIGGGSGGANTSSHGITPMMLGVGLLAVMLIMRK